MSEPEHNQQDERLQAVLKEWVIDRSLPPRFEEAVWRRLKPTEVSSSETTSLAKVLFSRIVSSLARPPLAWACVTLFLLIGGLAGLIEARRETLRVKEGLRARYVQSVSPSADNH